MTTEEEIIEEIIQKIEQETDFHHVDTIKYNNNAIAVIFIHNESYSNDILMLTMLKIDGESLHQQFHEKEIARKYEREYLY